MVTFCLHCVEPHSNAISNTNIHHLVSRQQIRNILKTIMTKLMSYKFSHCGKLECPTQKFRLEHLYSCLQLKEELRNLMFFKNCHSEKVPIAQDRLIRNGMHL